MNSQNILDIVSIRVKNQHIEPLTGEAEVYTSINRAKAASRILGGAGKVRALSPKDAKEFRKEYCIAYYWSEVKKAEEAVHLAFREVEATRQAWESEETPAQKAEDWTAHQEALRKHEKLSKILNEWSDKLNNAKQGKLS